jgi:HEPN superfamily AbiU2-like protein
MLNHKEFLEIMGTYLALVSSLEHHHTIRVCALWKRFDPTGFSIPTISTLLESADVFGILATGAAFTAFSYSPASPEYVSTAIQQLREHISKARACEKSDDLKRLRNFRDKKIAHPILTTRAERKAALPLPDPTAEEKANLLNAAERVGNAFATLYPTRYTNFEQTRTEARKWADKLFMALHF